MPATRAGFDWAIIDELGLMTERDRELIAGMRTSTSARDGRLIALSIRGESPMLEEMLERRGAPHVLRSTSTLRMQVREMTLTLPIPRYGQRETLGCEWASSQPTTWRRRQRIRPEPTSSPH